MAIVQLPQARSSVSSPVPLQLDFRVEKIIGFLQPEHLTSVVSLLMQFYSRVSFLWKLETPFVYYCIHILSVLDPNEILIPLEVASKWQEVFFLTFPASPLLLLIQLLTFFLIPRCDSSWPRCSWFALSLRRVVYIKKKVASS